MTNNVILALVIVTALGFDFTNGFHDTANAMATSIATKALKPKIAVALSAVLNLLGAFLSLSVAATIAKGIVNADLVTLNVVFAGLVGAIIWNIATWYFGTPSSSSHALIGGVVGAMLVHAGNASIHWPGIFGKVLIPALIAPVVAATCAALAIFIALKITKRGEEQSTGAGYRVAQIGSASLVSLAHGTNDAQKTMGIITLALIANHNVSQSSSVPLWVVIACGTAIALGTYLGGWRIIHTIGKGLTELKTPQGFAAETSSAAVLLASTHFGVPLSTTQVCSGSVVGVGLGTGNPVRWRVFGEMVLAWMITLPSAGIVGAGVFWVANAIGGAAGVVAMLLALIAICGGFYLASRRTPVNADNVNDEWGSDHEPIEDFFKDAA
jgi:PiT family inorganic phosphate transporter